jgi:hypothetical protein
MNKLFLLAIIFALFANGGALAQTADHDKALKPPFVAPMPDNSTWTISVTNSATSAKLPPGARVVNQFINTKSNPNRELLFSWTDGAQSQIWFWHGYRLEQNPGSSEVLVSQLAGGHDYQNADFFDLAWLQASNYLGIEDQNGRECYHFATEVKMERPPITIKYSAYIDVKTKRPVVWDAGSNHFELISFAMKKEDDPLVLPDAFAAQLKAYRLAAHMATPYEKQ